MRRLILLLIVPALVFTGCAEIGDRVGGAADSAINALATKALEDGVRGQLADAGIEMASGPDCETDLTRNGASLAGSADCDGVTVDGHEARARFDGSMSTSGCTGTITVIVNGSKVVDAAEVPDCSVNL